MEAGELCLNITMDKLPYFLSGRLSTIINNLLFYHK
nr:MAG TPA: hypothetical protein [Caudoviricetes sp.]